MAKTQGEIFDAILSLKPKARFSVKEDKSIVWNDDTQTQPTTSEINAEITRIKTANAHITPRREAYAELGGIENQLDMLYKDLVAGKLDSTGSWAIAIKKVKDENPKG